MITIKRLAKHLLENNLTQTETEKLLNQLSSQEYERGVIETRNRITSQRRKQISLQRKRIKKEFDDVMIKLTDLLSKNK